MNKRCHTQASCNGKSRKHWQAAAGGLSGPHVGCGPLVVTSGLDWCKVKVYKEVQDIDGGFFRTLPAVFSQFFMVLDLKLERFYREGC